MDYSKFRTRFEGRKGLTRAAGIMQTWEGLEELKIETDILVREIEHWIEVNDGHTIRLRFKMIDQCRLLVLKVWATRHFISVQEVLDLLIPSLRDQVNKYAKKYTKRGLGISCTALTSQKTHYILTERLRKRYLEDEHIGIWRSREQDDQIMLEELEDMGGVPKEEKQLLSVLHADSVEEFVSQYIARVDASKRSYDRAMGRDGRANKPYRGSPWR